MQKQRRSRQEKNCAAIKQCPASFSRDSFQFSSLTQSCPTSGFPVHHQLQEFTQTHVHQVGDDTTISCSVFPFSQLQSFPVSGSFQMSQFFSSGGQCIEVSALASILPMNIQDWFPLEWTCWISLQSRGHSRISSNTTVQKHQIFSAQLSL